MDACAQSEPPSGALAPVLPFPGMEREKEEEAPPLAPVVPLQARRRRKSARPDLPVPPGAAPSLPHGAACASHPSPDIWFSEDPREQGAARAVCRGCAVRAACLEEAMKMGAVDGIWAALSPPERETLRRVRRLRGQ